MNITDGLSLPQTPGYGRASLVLLISVALHLLIFWLAAGYVTLNPEPHKRTKSRPLHLTLTPPSSDASLPEPKDRPVEFRQKKARVPSNGVTSPAKQPPTPANTEKPHRTAPSAKAILATARSVTRQIAIRDQAELKPEKNSIESALDRAFNPQKEPPGVKRLADGTIRVVTDWGLIYCVRPSEDWRILGPEDNLPLNMTCN